jgi:isoquinoline 1-oxidoreductase
MSPVRGELSRRGFLALAAGCGLFVFFRFEPLEAQEPARPRARPSYPSDFNAYLRIGGDGRTTGFVGKVELGQGSETALAMLVAEELDVPLDSVDMVMGDTERCPWDMGTFGSLTIRQFGPVLRGAAAEARAVLLELAAERLGSPVARLVAEGGAVRDSGDASRRVTYARLVAGRRIERHVEEVPVKPVTAYRVVGRPAARKDALAKVTGRARYAADQALPNTLHARIVRPPAHGATLRDVDTAAVAEVEGARVVRDGDLIAVLHELPDFADRALARVTARWDRPAPTVDDESIFEHLVATAPPGETVGESGSLEAGAKSAAALFEHTYRNAYVAHAPVETHSAVARVEGGKATVWASTQAPFMVRNQVAEALGCAPGDVRVITPYVGGGFGGKTGARQAVEAARLSRAVGRPVQVVWDRAEEFFHDTFRPAAVVEIRSGLGADGKMCLWDYKVIGAGDREAKSFYDVPHQRTVSAGGWQGGNPPGMHPFGVGPWRAPSVNTNTFARESQVDLMAARAGVDPLEFRLEHLSDPRMRRVLQAAAERFGWRPRRAPSGRGAGVACATYLGTYVATMAEVEVDRASGRVRVARVVCAQDMGVVVNPDGARQQTEGALTMGLGYALTEEVRFKGGEVLDRNFDSYEIPRFSWLPRIECLFIDNPSTPASGCGEPPIVCVGAVIANAIHDATGARLFRLPMTPQRVGEALERK